MQLFYKVKSIDDNKRLIDVLCNTLSMSRLLTKRIRLYGTVLVNNSHHRMIDNVFTDDQIFLSYNEPTKPEPENCLERAGIDVLFFDKNIIVLNKPSGIVTHHTANHQNNTILDHFNEFKLHPVSRLDRETSGIIIMARDPHSHYKLSLQHQNKTIVKRYIAINHGIFPFDKGTINASISRKPNSIMLRHVSANGDIAITNFENIQKFKNLNTSINNFTIETGRTHQIRVHSLYCNNPIIGDGLYGASSNDNKHYQKSAYLDNIISRQALHACYVSFEHPLTSKRMEFSQDIPIDMNNLIEIMKNHDSQIN